MSTLRPVRRVLQAQTQREGGGFTVRRPFPVGGLISSTPSSSSTRWGPSSTRPVRRSGARPSAPRLRDRHLLASRAAWSTRTPPGTAASCAPATCSG